MIRHKAEVLSMQDRATGQDHTVIVEMDKEEIRIGKGKENSGFVLFIANGELQVTTMKFGGKDDQLSLL